MECVAYAIQPVCMRRERRFGEVVNGATTSTGEIVLSHALIHKAPATSSIVPVFLMPVNEPQKEILTYALLETQSDSSFVLEDLVRELNVNTQPLQMKLSTLTVADTIIVS